MPQGPTTIHTVELVYFNISNSALYTIIFPFGIYSKKNIFQKQSGVEVMETYCIHLKKETKKAKFF